MFLKSTFDFMLVKKWQRGIIIARKSDTQGSIPLGVKQDCRVVASLICINVLTYTFLHKAITFHRKLAHFVETNMRHLIFYMGQYQPLFAYFRPFHISQFKYKLIKA